MIGHSVYYVMNISISYRDAHPEFAMLLLILIAWKQPDKQKVRYNRVVLLGYLVIDFIFIMELMRLMMREPILLKKMILMEMPTSIMTIEEEEYIHSIRHSR